MPAELSSARSAAGGPQKHIGSHYKFLMEDMGNMQGKNYYISVAGVMGSGKTTVVGLLARSLNFHLFEEAVDENFFLPLFYKEPHRWAFHAQLFYLREKAKQLAKIPALLQKTSVVQDSPIYQDYFTYAKAQHFLGRMSPEEFRLYEDFFRELNQNLPAPHLIIQLDTSLPVLAARIQKRARGYETEVDTSYIQLLAKLQQEWIKNHPHLRIVSVCTDHLDLAENPGHQKEFISMVRDRLSL